MTNLADIFEESIDYCSICSKRTLDLIISILPNVNEGVVQTCKDCTNDLKCRLNEAEAKISIFKKR